MRSKKVHQNEVNFAVIEIISKKYVEAMLIFHPSESQNDKHSKHSQTQYVKVTH